MHLRYAPTDFELELDGIDIKARWPMSVNSFDWNVTHSPSQSGIIALWLGAISFAIRERGMWAGLVTPRQFLWSRTNCSVVTASFSQLRMVASSMLPLFGDEQAANAANSKQLMMNNVSFMFLL